MSRRSSSAGCGIVASLVKLPGLVPIGQFCHEVGSVFVCAIGHRVEPIERDQRAKVPHPLNVF